MLAERKSKKKMKNIGSLVNNLKNFFLPLSGHSSEWQSSRKKRLTSLCQRIWKIQCKQRQSLKAVPPEVHFSTASLHLFEVRGVWCTNTLGCEPTFHSPAYGYPEPSDREREKAHTFFASSSPRDLITRLHYGRCRKSIQRVSAYLI